MNIKFIMFVQVAVLKPVSYTHLDVYKRQMQTNTDAYMHESIHMFYLIARACVCVCMCSLECKSITFYIFMIHFTAVDIIAIYKTSYENSHNTNKQIVRAIIPLVLLQHITAPEN